MKTITVNKTQLLKTLRENREKHLEILKETKENYWKTIEADLKNQLKKVSKKVEQNSPMKSFNFFRSIPVDFCKEYDKAISMLEWNVEEEVELDQIEFERYVRDNWDWKKQFLASNSSYSATASDTMQR